MSRRSGFFNNGILKVQQISITPERIFHARSCYQAIHSFFEIQVGWKIGVDFSQHIGRRNLLAYFVQLHIGHPDLTF